MSKSLSLRITHKVILEDFNYKKYYNEYHEKLKQKQTGPKIYGNMQNSTDSVKVHHNFLKEIINNNTHLNSYYALNKKMTAY